MKITLIAFSIFSCLSSTAQWTTSPGNVYNTNVGAVSVVRNTGNNNGQVFIVNPVGQGSMIIGEPNTGSGGYTSFTLGISGASNGLSYMQSIKSAGSAYGVLSLNPSGGNVGIGTDDPGSFKLAVEGKIGARELKVTLQSPWPDYVFSPQYDLMDLRSLRKFIALNNHLPGIPSQKEVKENDGFEVGQMTTSLLKKVEELTLYLLKLDEENKKMKARIEELESKSSK